jgi:hypothetical protein
MEQNREGRKRRKGRRSGGQDKGNRHYAGRISEIVVVCTLVRGAASGTMLLIPRAAILRKALALLDFDRHHDRRTPDFLGFWPEART